jgi:hypothetical protein
MENNSDETMDNISWIPEETNTGAAESQRGDVNKSDADSAAFIAGWDSELSEISSSEEDGRDESNSGTNKVSPSMLVCFPGLNHFVNRNVLYQVSKSVFLGFPHALPTTPNATPGQAPLAFVPYDTAVVSCKPLPAGRHANHAGRALGSTNVRGWIG